MTETYALSGEIHSYPHKMLAEGLCCAGLA